MSGFGAIVKAIARTVENAVSAAERGLRSVIGDRRPKPCPIYVHAEPGRRR